MLSAHLILLFAAFVCVCLAAANWPATRISLGWTSIALLIASMLV